MLGQGKNNFPWHAPSVFCAGRSHRIIMFKEQSIRIIPSGERHTRDYGWLKTSWLFSFNDYQDRDNLSFGDLRAFNDDVVQPGEGFADHRHSEMEIVTFVLKGEISHQDSAGSQGTVAQDQVQRMSAGTGVIHSEFNRGSVPVHMYQIWFFPTSAGCCRRTPRAFRPRGAGPAAGLASGRKGGLDMSRTPPCMPATSVRRRHRGGRTAASCSCTSPTAPPPWRAEDRPQRPGPHEGGAAYARTRGGAHHHRHAGQGAMSLAMDGRAMG